MDEIIEKEIINIENMIYEVNGVEVMLDSDLAKLYQVETKRINEAVNRNKKKFPDRISWILNENELQNLRSQFATSSSTTNYGGRRYTPRVFTEQGVYMLATILKSKVATEVSIRIMDTFVKMRHYINYNKSFLPHRFLLLEEKVDNNSFHDRFIILDRKKLYSCGASFKDLGKKCFAINEFNDKEYLDKLIEVIYNK